MGRKPTLRLLASGLIALLAACGPERHPPEWDGGDPGDVAEAMDGPDATGADVASTDQDAGHNTCVDEDGDGFGTGCVPGPDCNDHDPQVTDDCYRCLVPATGCPCAPADSRRFCDLITDSDSPTPGGTCHLGERLCENGTWTHCLALDGTARVIIPPTSCGSSCDPACQSSTICPDRATDLTASGVTATGVVLGSSSPSPLCPGAGTGGIQLPDATGTSYTGAGAPMCPTPLCGASCCTSNQACVTTGTTGTGAGCAAGTGSGVSYQDSTCGLACGAGTTHCGDPPTDLCCASGAVCHQGGCVLGRPSNCMRNSDCPLVAQGQVCFSFGVCSTGTSAAGNCACTNAPNNGCFTSARAQGFQEVDDIFNTNDGRDARRLRFARYMRGMARSPTSNGPCNSNADCPVGRSVASTVMGDPYPCTSANCSPTNAGLFQGFVPADKNYETILPFLSGLDWKWVDFVRYNSSGTADTSGNNEYPWNGLIFDLVVPSNQVALFSIRNAGGDCCSQGMEWQVWMTNNPGATTVAAAGTIDPNQWNITSFKRMYTEGWTRNPRAIGVPTDRNDLSDSTTNGNAVSDAYTSVWVLPSGCAAMRFAAVNVGNMNQPGNSCSTGRVSNRLDAVAGLDANGTVPAIYHVLPYHGAAGPDSISSLALVSSADIYFLVDTSSSMDQELAALKNSVTGSGGVFGCTIATGGLVGATRCVVADPWFGIGALRDFNVSPYGASTDYIYQNGADMLPDYAPFQTALNALTTAGGGDTPDGQIPALYAVATGQGFPFGAGAGYLASRTTCPSGRRGYPCFRNNALPIALLFTDNVFHNGPAQSDPYDATTLRAGAGISYPAPVPTSGNEDTGTAWAIPSDTAPWTASGSTFGMRSDGAAPCASNNGIAPDAVFRLNITASRSVVIDTNGSTFDTVLSVYAADGTLVGCNNDVDTATQTSRVGLSLAPGTYYIWVGGNGVAAGNFTLRYGPMTAPRFDDTVAALNSIGARVAIIDSCGSSATCPANALSEANALASQTRSVDTSNNPAVYTIATDGTNIATTAVTAINNLVTNLKMDVTATAEDNPATPSIDERCFLRPIAGAPYGAVRLASGSGGERPPYASTACVSTGTSASASPYVAQQCAPGATVNFAPEFLNNCALPAMVDQLFTFDIVVRGNNAYEIERVPVTILVPHASVPPSGTYSYVTNASNTCPSGQLPTWLKVLTDATFLPGTSISVDVRTANTSAGLSSAPWVPLGSMNSAPAPTLPSASTISAALQSAGQGQNLPFLEVRYTLFSDPAMVVGPVLNGYQLQFDCVDGT